MRNISQANDFCNGTRLIVTQIHPNILAAIIISGSNIGDKVYIPRIIMLMQDAKWPFIMCRKQFPIKLSYAITITIVKGKHLICSVYSYRDMYFHIGNFMWCCFE